MVRYGSIRLIVAVAEFRLDLPGQWTWGRGEILRDSPSESEVPQPEVDTAAT